MWLFCGCEDPRGGLRLSLSPLAWPGTLSGGWHQLAIRGRVRVQQLLAGREKRERDCYWGEVRVRVRGRQRNQVETARHREKHTHTEWKTEMERDRDRDMEVPEEPEKAADIERQRRRNGRDRNIEKERG